MFYRVLNTSGAQSVPTKGFLGLNRRKKGQEGECVACSNVSGDEFPVLSSIRGDKEICRLPSGGFGFIIAFLPEEDGSFTGITQRLENGNAVQRFYYKGVDKSGSCTIEFDEDSKLIRTDGKIILLPQMLQFEYWKEDAVLENLGRSFLGGETDSRYYNGESFFRLLSELVEPNVTESVVGTYARVGANKDFAVGESVLYELDAENEYPGETDTVLVMQPAETRYLEDETDAYNRAKIIRSAVIARAGYIALYDYKGDFVNFDHFNGHMRGGKVKIYKNIPRMSNFCIFQNRLWGTAENGEAIYASAPGEYDTFFRFQNVATDSWSVDIPDYNKPFTGMAVYNEAIYCFKEDKVYVIYGSYAQNFSVDRTMDGCGCIQSDSVVVAGNALYWLGHEGIYRYTGGTPKLISNNLAKKYTYAKATAGNGVIYWKLTYKDGDGLGGEFLRYDTEYGLWHAIPELEERRYLGGATLGNRTFANTASTIYELEAGEYGEWSFESVDFYNDTFDNTGAFQIHLRADLKAGSSIKVEYKGSGESEWQNCGEYIADKDISIKECYIPRYSNFPSYRYRLSGTGEVYIYELERIFHKGGRNVR